MGVREYSGQNLPNKLPPPPQRKKRKQRTTDTWRCYVWHPSLPSRVVSQGLVLVGSINGGQASNLCTLIAGGDVALSVPWSGEFRCCCGCGCCSRTWEPKKRPNLWFVVFHIGLDICYLPRQLTYPTLGKTFVKDLKSALGRDMLVPQKGI